MSICNCGPCTASTCPNNTATTPPNQKPQGLDILALLLRILLFHVCMIGLFIWFYISDFHNLPISNTTKCEGSRIYDISHRFQPNLPRWEKKVIYRNFDVGFDVDTLDLATLNGPALLVDVPRHTNITAEVLMSLNIPEGVKRVLFRTLNTARQLMWKKQFDTSYVGFMKDGAKWLVDNTDIKLVGVDYLSAAAYDELFTSHHAFLEDREIIVIGGLKLDNVDAGIYNVHCLPQRLVLDEVPPVRCILMK